MTATVVAPEAVRPEAVRPEAVRPEAVRPRGDLTQRVAAATLAGIARFGLAKLTVDDIAREAQCSRATLYRVFPSKHEIVEAAVLAEADRVTREIVRSASDAPTFTDAVTDVIVTGARELHASAALRFVAEHEPELLHPHLSFAGGDQFLTLAAARLACVFTRFTDDPARAAEWTARVGLCLVWFPHPPVDVADRAAVRAYVDTFVVPGLAAA